MARWFQYQAKTEPLPVPVVAVATVLTVVQFTGLFQYQVKAEPVFVPPPPAVIATTTTEQPVFPRSIIYQSIAYTPFVESVTPPQVVIVPSVVNTNVQFKHLLQYQVRSDPTVVPAAPVVTAVEPTTITSDVIFRRSLIYQSVAWSPTPVAAETITEDKWYQAWSQPVRIKPKVAFQQNLAWSGYTPAAAEVITEDKWHQAWSQPIRIKPRVVFQQELAWSGHTPTTTEDKWHQAWSQPVRVIPKVAFQQSLFWSGFTPAAAITAIEPTTITSQVTFQRSIVYQSEAWTPQVVTPETITEDKWHQPWSTPVRTRKFPTAEQQVLAWSGYTPAASTAVPYFNMVEGDTGLTFQKTIIYQISAQAESPETHVFWYQPLSEPVRQKPGLSAALQRAFFAPEKVIPQAPDVTSEDKWHQSWSQPVRVRPKVVFQQNLAWSGHTPVVVPPTTAVESTTLTSQVVFPRSVIYQSLAWGVTTPSTIPPVTAVEPTTISSPVIFRRSIIYQSLAWTPIPITPPAAVPYFQYVQGDTGLTFQKTIIYQVSAQAESSETHVLWYRPWSEPVRRKPGLSAALQRAFFAPEAVIPNVPETITEDKWHQPLSIPLRKKSGLGTWEQRDLFWSGHTPTVVPPVTAVTTSTNTSQVSFPRSIIYQSLAWTPKIIIPETITEDKWHQPWSLPVRTRKFPTAEQQTLAWSGHTPAPVVVTYFPYVQGDTGLTFQKTIIYQQSAQAESPETHVLWYVPWSEPVRKKPGLSAALQRAFSAPEAVIPNVPETITEDKWHQPWSIPVRKKSGLGTWEQRDLFWSGFTPAPPTITAIASITATSSIIFQRSVIYQSVAWAPYPVTPETITEDKWHQGWSIPVKLKYQFRTDLQQSFAAPPVYPNLLRTIPWYAPLSEPVRLKKGTPAQLQQAFGTPPSDPILLRIIPWYAPLAEPVREKKGLRARLQQFFTTDANKPPQPPVFVILNATDTNNDVASIFAVVYNPPVRVYVSIKEVPGSDPTYASIEETD